MGAPRIFRLAETKFWTFLQHNQILDDNIGIGCIFNMTLFFLVIIATVASAFAACCEPYRKDRGENLQWKCKVANTIQIQECYVSE
jgi:hypothetical protein